MKKRVYVDTKASTYSLMVAGIGKAIWKMQEQFKPKCLAEKMTSQYYPTSIFTNYNHVVFEDTLDFSSLHVTITRYQHTKTHICSEASWNNTASNDKSLRGATFQSS